MSCCGKLTLIDMKSLLNFLTYNEMHIKVVIPGLGFQCGVYHVGTTVTPGQAHKLLVNKNAQILTIVEKPEEPKKDDPKKRKQKKRVSSNTKRTTRSRKSTKTGTDNRVESERREEIRIDEPFLYRGSETSDGETQSGSGSDPWE